MKPELHERDEMKPQRRWPVVLYAVLSAPILTLLFGFVFLERLRDCSSAVGNYSAFGYLTGTVLDRTTAFALCVIRSTNHNRELPDLYEASVSFDLEA